jgi:hypothetical protein
MNWRIDEPNEKMPPKIINSLSGWASQEYRCLQQTLKRGSQNDCKQYYIGEYGIAEWEQKSNFITCEKPSQNHICDKGVAKNHTKTLDTLVIDRLNIIETDFILGKRTLFEHFYQTFAVVKRAIQPCDIFPYHRVVSHGQPCDTTCAL